VTPRRHHERGQASIELVAILPLAVVVVLAALQVLAAGAAQEVASAAAEAGAAAILQDADPAAAAKQALGRSATRRATIAVRNRRVRVTVRPTGPARPIADLLEQTAVSDAGPGPAVTTSTSVVRGGDGEGARPPRDR
jgi:hypothetical protein